MICKVIEESYLVEPVRLLTFVVCAALPESIGNLQNLTQLEVNANALQGKCRVVPRTSATTNVVYVLALPDSISQLSSLEYLDCSDCELTGTSLGLPVVLA
jgi:Leucine-rich repeat (LRR) protein